VDNLLGDVGLALIQSKYQAQIFRYLVRSLGGAISHTRSIEGFILRPKIATTNLAPPLEQVFFFHIRGHDGWVSTRTGRGTFFELVVNTLV